MPLAHRPRGDAGAAGWVLLNRCTPKVLHFFEDGCDLSLCERVTFTQECCSEFYRAKHRPSDHDFLHKDRCCEVCLARRKEDA